MYAPAKQEQLDAFELGSKYTAFGGYAQINGAVYYYLYKDKQLLGSFPDPLFGQLPVLQNAPEARVYGAEFDITAEPLEGLSIVASGAYVDTEIREYEGTDELGNEVDFAGRPFNYAPKFETSLLLHYVHGLTHTLNSVLGQTTTGPTTPMPRWLVCRTSASRSIRWSTPASASNPPMAAGRPGCGGETSPTRSSSIT